MFLFHILFSLQTDTLANIMNNIPRRDTMTKLIKFKFYVTEYAQAEYLRHGRKVEDLVNYVASELERALNLYLEKSDRPITIAFKPIFVSEIPPEIQLDKCDTNMLEIGSILNALNEDTSDMSVIAVLTCHSQPYIDVFRVVGQEVPYVTHTLTSQCTTRTIIFLETEETKFLAALSTAMIRAANVNVLNPLMFEEVNNGDQGVRYDIRISNETMEQIKENRCFYGH